MEMAHTLDTANRNVVSVNHGFDRRLRYDFVLKSSLRDCSGNWMLGGQKEIFKILKISIHETIRQVGQIELSNM